LLAFKNDLHSVKTFFFPFLPLTFLCIGFELNSAIGSRSYRETRTLGHLSTPKAQIMRVSVCVCLLVCVCCTLRILNVVQTLLLRCCSHINYANENKINNALLWFFLRCVLLIIFSYFVLLENFSLSFLAWDIIFLLSFPSVWFYCSFQLSLWLSLSLVPFNFISFSLLIHLLFVRSHFSAEINIKISFPVPSAIFTNFSSAT